MLSLKMILVIFSIVCCISLCQRVKSNDVCSDYSSDDASRGFYRDVAASSNGGRLNYTKSLEIR